MNLINGILISMHYSLLIRWIRSLGPVPIRYIKQPLLLFGDYFYVCVRLGNGFICAEANLWSWDKRPKRQKA